jgi:hypothetical protein
MRAIVTDGSVCSSYIDGTDFLVSAVDSKVVITTVTRNAARILQKHNTFFWASASHEFFFDMWTFLFSAESQERSADTLARILGLLGENIHGIEIVYAN